MSRVLTLALILGGAVAVARGVVYGSGSGPAASPLEGWVLLSAFTGGVALAFSGPFLLVLAPFLTVVSGEVYRGVRVLAGIFVGAFALAFLVTISGVPGVVARPIHESERLIDPLGGLLFLVGGLLSFAGVFPVGPVRSSPSPWRRALRSFSAAILGATAGTLMYHELDPADDSVFSATANAVAISHAPFTVAVFTAGLGLTYLAAGSLTTAWASRASWGERLVLGGRMLSGIVTALIGAALLANRFGAIRALLF